MDFRSLSMRLPSFTLFAAACLAHVGYCHSGGGVNSEPWLGRSIYFVVTDRFAQSGGGGKPGCSGKGWCGGTIKGVEEKLGYIQDMGFDAIWITPVVEQVPWLDHWNGTGYHGYWARDFNKIEPRIGSEGDLKSLKAACAQRGMLLMVDIVANHVGPIHTVAQIQQLGTGLNDPSATQFHQLNRGVKESLQSYINKPVEMSDAGSCWPWYNFGNGCNYTVILEGWFGDLADLNQEDPKVKDYLLHWIHNMQEKYGIDGFRLDTVTYLPKPFLQEFQAAAGVYIIGEVVTSNFTMHSSYSGDITGLLNFPLTQHLKYLFSPKGSLQDLEGLLHQQRASHYPNLHLLGNFIDNHDNDRFLFNHTGDETQLRNGLAFTLLWPGIPIVYYGTEQPIVSNQHDNRYAMWPHYNQTRLSTYLKSLNTLRKQFGFGHAGSSVTTEADVVFSEKNSMAFVRDKLFVVTSNTGQDAAKSAGCAEVDALPDQWHAICTDGHGKPARLQVVFGDVPVLHCQENNVTHKSLFCWQKDDAEPFALALG